jgi:pimeloyl-ACP methyl ester carboxylesterase
MAVALNAREQTRARYPDEEGYVERDGVRVFYEVYGAGEPTILLLPTWSIIHSRHWKPQIPYLARHFRVLTFDGRGNGRSDRPRDPEAYTEQQFADDALAVLDATGTEQAVLVSLSLGSQRALMLTADHPERVTGAIFIAPSLPIEPGHDYRLVHPFDEPLDRSDGWAKFNRHYWIREYRDFLEFFFSQAFSEPHSTKPIEDAVGWGLETDGETLGILSISRWLDDEALRALCALVRCPVLVIHGSDDRISPHARGAALAEATGGELATLAGSGHLPHARDPVVVNELVRGFVGRVA